MRPQRRAPKFCATKVVTAVPSESATSQMMPSMRAESPQPVTTVAPNELIEDWTTMLETE